MRIIHCLACDCSAASFEIPIRILTKEKLAKLMSPFEAKRYGFITAYVKEYIDTHPEVPEPKIYTLFNQSEEVKKEWDAYSEDYDRQQIDAAGWTIYIEDDMIKGLTSMDNFSMEEYFIFLGIDTKYFKVEHG